MRHIATMVNYFVPILFIFCINQVKCQTDKSCNFATCGDCISYEVERCVWCSKDVFHKRRCRPLSYTNTNGSWCKDSIVNPNTTSKVEKNEPFSSNVQLRPQLIKMKARPGIEMNFTMSFKPAKDYPIDIYFLMDISYTMIQKMRDLKNQAINLYVDLKSYTNNVRLGIGSFNEKPGFPHFHPITYDSHSFKNEVPLTSNMEKFKMKIDSINFGSNFDDPEAGLDALMQAMKCLNEVGWRPEARRIIVLCTDSPYHSAGGGKIVGAIKQNDMQCHLENNTYSEALTFDYPSVSQINRVASEGNFGIIFAVTNNSINEYKELAAQIDGATFALLNDGESLRNILRKVYEEQASSAELKYQAPPFVEVNIHQSCKSNPKKNCESSRRHAIDISGTLKVKSCPPNGAKNQSYDVIVNPVGLPDKLTIQLQVDCKCDCEMEGGSVTDKCHGAGFMQCGICKCLPGSYGRDCRHIDRSDWYKKMDNCIQTIF